MAKRIWKVTLSTHDKPMETFETRKIETPPYKDAGDAGQAVYAALSKAERALIFVSRVALLLDGA